MIPGPESAVISGLSILHTIGALCWVGLVFISIAGYGAGLARAFGLRRVGMSVAAPAGFGAAILLGGVLNLLHWIMPAVLVGFVAVGLGLAAWLLRAERRARERRESVAGRWMFAALMVVFGVRMLSTVHTSFYEPSDDRNFYLAVPEKMIETHWFAPDPFSERRIMSSLGGNEFLQTLVLATQPLARVQMADWALGCVLLALLGMAIGVEFEVTAVQRYGFALILMVMPQVKLNLTFVILPSALFLGMVYVAAHRRLTAEAPGLQAVLLGGMAGAIASLKSTYVTHAVLFVVCVALLRWWKRGFRATGMLLAVAAMCCFVTMLPWMLASEQASGTWFYPLLGKGVQYSAYGQYAAPSNLTMAVLLHKVLPFTLPMLVLFLVELAFCEKDERDYTAAGLMLAAFLASTLVGMATGGDSVRRYNFPCILPALCLCFVLVARRRNLAAGVRWWRGLEAAVALGLVGVAVDVGMSRFTNEYAVTLQCLRDSLFDSSLTNGELRRRYAAVQRAIPTDGRVLATVTMPYLFNFGEREILLADVPGGASPKPGWPARQSGDTLARYLLSQHIRYLAFAYNECDLRPPYRDCAELIEAESAMVMANKSITQWIRSETEIQRDANRQYRELGQTRRHVYDDGRIFVLDLAS